MAQAIFRAQVVFSLLSQTAPQRMPSVVTSTLMVMVPCVAGVTTATVAGTAELGALIKKKLQARKKVVEKKPKKCDLSRLRRAVGECWRIVNFFELSELFKEAYISKLEDAEKKVKKKIKLRSSEHPSDRTLEGTVTPKPFSEDQHVRERTEGVQQQLTASQLEVKELQARLDRISAVDEDLLSWVRLEMPMDFASSK
uniref:Uncharacterized protein n=1 Tax=Noctiluca scintillans TaxID=2966 RepID=A0A7S1ACT3_NOCSC